MKKLFIAVATALACLSGAAAATADEIGDQIKRGLEQYENGNIGQALTELDFALSQMRQKQSEAVAAILPEAPDGWKAEKAKASAQEFMGAGAMATRVYRQTGGKAKASIEIVKLGQGLGAMLNPMMLQKVGGGKPVLVGGMKGALAAKGETGAELTISISAEHILKISVTNSDDAEATAQDFAKAIDVKALQKAIQ
ncbi:hypothetical protein Deba_1736 [Desulfarculus baarsii DSM 2075]|uniref:Uncharacterized protein n=1 Tax=Desulfarculus baarsii (strain ATCC 33931 / DSM 2075 / LMG 7858 / VKM B-1802 / 2st14) TaxID=644282 RepID=E1QHR0_DESB2|nr:hypothetical protein [Desulfarculus baarsii]ADK85103.1 hypothetical protein Deba_1736 [Desulfarculus baarsii DSM 2075]